MRTLWLRVLRQHGRGSRGGHRRQLGPRAPGPTGGRSIRRGPVVSAVWLRRMGRGSPGRGGARGTRGGGGRPRERGGGPGDGQTPPPPPAPRGGVAPRAPPPPP